MSSVKGLLSACEAAFDPVDGWATLDLSSSAKLVLALLHAYMEGGDGHVPSNPQMHRHLGYSQSELKLALDELVLAGVLYKKVKRDGEGRETHSGYWFVSGRYVPKSSLPVASC